MSAEPVFTPWTDTVTQATTEWVLPDGCRDFIVVTEDGRQARSFLSSLDLAPRPVELEPGKLYGFRLKPGVGFKLAEAQAELRRVGVLDSERTG